MKPSHEEKKTEQYSVLELDDTLQVENLEIVKAYDNYYGSVIFGPEIPTHGTHSFQL